MELDKIKVIKDYKKLSDDIKKQIKLVYPLGYSKHLIDFLNITGYKLRALPFETEDEILLIKMSTRKANQLVKDDPDFDDHGRLKKNLMEQYIEDYGDLQFLFDNSPYDYDKDY